MVTCTKRTQPNCKPGFCAYGFVWHVDPMASSLGAGPSEQKEQAQGSVEEASTAGTLAAGLSAALLHDLPPHLLEQVIQVQQATLASLKASRQSIAEQTKELNITASKLSAAASQSQTLQDIRTNMDQLYALARQARKALQQAGVEVAEADIDI